jgi:hypothetical protein
MIHGMSTTQHRAPFATERSAAEVNEEIRALWQRTGGMLSGEQRREYQRLVLEWAAASPRSHAQAQPQPQSLSQPNSSKAA